MMRYATFEDSTEGYKVALLVNNINKSEIQKAYIDPTPLEARELLVLSLFQHPTKKKTPISEVKEYITSELLPVLEEQNIEYVLCADAAYFKKLTDQTKAEAFAGYVLDSPYGSFKVIYIPNYETMWYNPDHVKELIQRAATAYYSHQCGVYAHPGNDLLKSAHYPINSVGIADWLGQLYGFAELTCDVETFSLKHVTSGIGTCSFAWNKHEGVAFPVDLMETDLESQQVRRNLRDFFENYSGKLIFHNAAFDIYILIYQLWMKNILDTEGLLKGLSVMTRHFDCTKIITYLATNSCAGNDLSLKFNAQEFAGNYALHGEDIKDITKVPLEDLLRYNLIDSCSTWYVKEKHEPTMDADQQRDIYENLFLPSLIDIIEMQLTGMPVNIEKVAEARKTLQADEDSAVERMKSCNIMRNFKAMLDEKWVNKRNSELKVKRVTTADSKEEFNPNSSTQLQALLFEMLDLPILSYTDSKLPSTDSDTIKDLQKHTSDPDILAFLEALLDYKAVNKILTSFIPAMEGAVRGPDGWHYLFGNFNLGGTLSGRLSSSDPNLQNLPSAGTRYAKIIKECFEAPPGWLFIGLDFDSLEDRISALTTRDPNKLKVYTDGYDGHCLRAHAYFGDRMPDIDPNSVTSINSIKKLYKEERQDSKIPTFALTYRGTWRTLTAKAGFSDEQAKDVEAKYHELYRVSDEWVDAKLEQASKDGYITAAFGLRVRTPLLKQVILGNSKTPYAATAESRSAGNALGQSWCLLNNRSSVEFRRKVRQSKLRLDIRPSAHIHDAQYMMIRDNMETLLYVNEHLVKAVRWQEHPEIAHPQVKLGGEVSIFYPNWASEIVIPNEATPEEIKSVIAKAMAP